MYVTIISWVTLITGLLLKNRYFVNFILIDFKLHNVQGENHACNKYNTLFHSSGTKLAMRAFNVL